MMHTAEHLLATENTQLKKRIAELTDNHRKHAAKLISERGILRDRAETAESELARRDTYR